MGLPSLDTNALLAFLPYLQPLIEEALSRVRVPGIDVKTARLGPPVPRPEKIIVAGGNYRSHVDEAMGKKDAPIPSEPLIIFKPSNTVIGPHEISCARRRAKNSTMKPKLPSSSAAAVATFRGRRLRAYRRLHDRQRCDRARFGIQGYASASHVLADHPRQGHSDRRPDGPWIATKDEIPDPHKLRLRCWVNGELRQDGMSSEMIVDIPGLIEDFSKVLGIVARRHHIYGHHHGLRGISETAQIPVRREMSYEWRSPGLGVMETPIADGVPSINLRP